MVLQEYFQDQSQSPISKNTQVYQPNDLCHIVDISLHILAPQEYCQDQSQSPISKNTQFCQPYKFSQIEIWYPS